MTVIWEELPQRTGWRDFREYEAEVEARPHLAASLSRARKRLARELFEKETIASLRLSKGFSQTQLAQRVGMAQPNLSRLESGGDDPHLSTLKRLADALGESIERVSAAILRSRHHDDDE